MNTDNPKRTSLSVVERFEDGTEVETQVGDGVVAVLPLDRATATTVNKWRERLRVMACEDAMEELSCCGDGAAVLMGLQMIFQLSELPNGSEVVRGQFQTMETWLKKQKPALH